MRVAEDGARLAPSGLDPYALPWVQGASSTVHLSTRRKYAAQLTDLYEKLALLRSKRKPKIEQEYVPTYGPRRRPAEFRAMDGRPTNPDDWADFVGDQRGRPQ